MSKTRIIIAEIGSPKSASIKDVRTFLKDFLSSRKVVDLNPLFWKTILHLFILPFRSPKVARKYKWLIDKFDFQPLIHHTEQFVQKLQKQLHPNAEVKSCFVLDPASLQEAFSDLDDDHQITIIPQYPQYSEATVGLIKEKIKQHCQHPNLNFVDKYPFFKNYIDQSAKKINELLTDDVNVLLLSFHGYPMKRIENGDPYLEECYKTFKKICEKIDSIEQENIHICFQSKFGGGRWTTPSTDKLALRLIKDGDEKIAIYCPSFLVDSLETEHEINLELRESIEDAGGELLFISPINGIVDQNT